MSREAADQVQRALGTVDRLGTSSRSIGDVVQLIDGVARQIDLLSLNASVEAARAGEVGAGFAVVATEVKRLATRTRAATGEIRRMSAEVQHDVACTVTEMNEIAATMARLQEASVQAAGEMVRQSDATTEIARCVADAADESDRVRAVAGRVSEGAVETASAAGRFMDASEQLNSVASGLQQMLAGFRV